jgi:hypothetical protein
MAVTVVYCTDGKEIGHLWFADDGALLITNRLFIKGIRLITAG